MLTAMHQRLQFALDEALVQAHGLMQFVRGLLAPVMARGQRAAARRMLRLAEAFLRRALVLLSLEEVLPPPRPPAPKKPSPRPATPARPARLALAEPVAAFPNRPIQPMPAGLFTALDPNELVPAGALAARLARLNAILADPIRSARRIAFLRRRRAAKGETVLRRALIAPRLAGEAGRRLAGWLKLIDESAREGLTYGPG